MRRRAGAAPLRRHAGPRPEGAPVASERNGFRSRCGPARRGSRSPSRPASVFVSLGLCGSRRRDLAQRERQDRRPGRAARRPSRFDSRRARAAAWCTPSPLGQVSRNGVMPITAPSFSRTTRAPGGSDTIAAVTFGAAFGGRRDGRRRRDRRGCRGAGATSRSSAGPRPPRPARQPERDAADHQRAHRDRRCAPPARSSHLRRWPIAPAPACVNVVGRWRGAAPGVCGRAVFAVGRAGRRRPSGQRRVHVGHRLHRARRAPWRDTRGSAARAPPGSKARAIPRRRRRLR